MTDASVRAAVVQAGAVPFDSDACVAKAVRLIGERRTDAGRRGQVRCR